MPISKHFGGNGAEVMKSMTKTYGADKAKSVFYATENSMKSHLDHMKKSGKLKSKAMPKGKA